MEDDRYIKLPDRMEINEYHMMEAFAYDHDERLVSAIKGRKAFRRFKDAADEIGLLEEWYEFRDNCYRSRAEEWCMAHDLEWEDDDNMDEISHENESLIKEFEAYLIAEGYAKKTIRLYTHHAKAYIDYIIDGTDGLMDDNDEGTPLRAVDGVRHISWYLQRLRNKFGLSKGAVEEEARGIKRFYSWMKEMGRIDDAAFATVGEQIEDALLSIE